jgi:single-stranded DNA-specific DHH superfamily exonuclease
MLNLNQIQEIREHLDNSRNPIFLFDNDPDGLCSFLLLQRFIGRGRGVAIKSIPNLDKSYFKKVEEFHADSIFVLDKPVISPEFIKLAEDAAIPLIHIDHHNVPSSPIKYYYNTFYESGKNEPVSYLCYKIANRPNDNWLCAIGCITDSFLPEFIEELSLEYPELFDFKYKTAYDILYRTRFGEICQIISFALRDKTSNVVHMMKFLMNASSASDILEENSKTKPILKRFNDLNEKYRRILKKADGCLKGNYLIYSYSGDLSINQYVANELMYMHPHKIIMVIYSKGNLSNVSLRWDKDIRTPTVYAVSKIEGATGGGHENSTGARVPTDKLEDFKKILIQEIEKVKKK